MSLHVVPATSLFSRGWVWPETLVSMVTNHTDPASPAPSHLLFMPRNRGDGKEQSVFRGSLRNTQQFCAAELRQPLHHPDVCIHWYRSLSFTRKITFLFLIFIYIKSVITCFPNRDALTPIQALGQKLHSNIHTHKHVLTQRCKYNKGKNWTWLSLTTIFFFFFYSVTFTLRCMNCSD